MFQIVSNNKTGSVCAAIYALSPFRSLSALLFTVAMLTVVMVGALYPERSYAQSCSGAADMWYANDESGSVSASEMTQALDFLYQVADGFVFDDISGAKAGVFGWSNNLTPARYIIPASDTYADQDDTGFLDPNRDGSDADNNIVVDGDGTGIRELYQARTFGSGTWLAAATNELGSLIGSTVDTDMDGVTDNGRRDGVPQIAVLLTDATASQLKNAGSGSGAGQEGGSDWDAALASLATAGPDGTSIVLMLIDVAAVAYGMPGAGNEGTAGDPAVRTLIDSFVTNYGVTLYVGGTYAEIADPVQGFVSGLVNAVCELADIALYIKNQPRTYTTLDPYSVTFEFSDDVSGFELSDILVGNGSASNLVQVSPSIYTADITPNPGNADITIDVLVNAAQSIPDAKPSRPAAQVITEYDGDGDGIGDTSEGTTTDSDMDGTFDNEDLDSDNDGIPDAIENAASGGVDTDGDGIFDYLDLDSDNDGLLDILESGSTIALSLDSDGDGQIDAGEAFGSDGLADALQTGGDGGPLNYTVADSDADIRLDFRDLDSDGDALADLIESGLSESQIAALDIDADGDIDPVSQTPANTVGSDGIVDSLQGSVDGDPLSYTVADTDQDLVRDALDLDTDNDGIPDLVESGSVAAALDANADGRLQMSEAPVGSDGIADAAQSGADGGALPTPLNSDAANETGTVVADFRDLDSDNDGLFDANESLGTAGTTDFNGDGFADGSDSNGDGMIDTGFVINPVDSAPADTPDYRNTDSNGAGVGDDNDADSNAAPLDVAPDDGVLDDTTDTDGDGIADVLDDQSGPGVLPVAAIIIVETASYTEVNESGSGTTDTFTVELQRPPLSNVVIDLSSADTSEAIIQSAAQITFTPLDWDTPKTVTVAGVADDFVDGTMSPGISLVVDNAQSSDEYDDLSEIVVVDVFDTTPDADGDGIADIFEGNGDTDGDGTPDSADTDSDNDNIPDVVEAGNDPEVIPDSDGDGVPDYRETDADNDGIIDALEVGPSVMVPRDSDNDGFPDFIDIDSDNDFIPDSIEDTNTPLLSGLDTVGAAPGEGNGIDDAIDVLVTGGVDANTNGVDDDFEPADADTDSLPNHIDLDSDGDGILDLIELGNIPVYLNSDSDGDGYDDAIDVDSTNGTDANGNGIDDAFEPLDSDGDGTPDYLDIDSDNDGIPDSVEAAPSGGSLPTLGGNDTDADGIDDAVDSNNGGSLSDANSNGISDDAEPVDTDGDGLPDYRDLDADNDSLLDIDEAGGTDNNLDGQVDDPLDEGAIASPTNSDADAVPDYRDLESDNPANDGSTGFDIDDNPLPAPGGAASFDVAPRDGRVDDDTDDDMDGIADVVDLDPTSFGGAQDSDNDMIPDIIDLDSDNDGIPDLAEGYDDMDPANSTDSDTDGVPDYLDLDSDNDGLFDVIEADPDATDIDNNGRIDGFIDAQPSPVADGLHDPVDANFTPHDSDDDGIADFRDIDSDGDSISDLTESVTSQTELDNIDGDGNGIIDNVDPLNGLPLDGMSQPVNLLPLDSDGDGQPNFRDLDSDNDGFSDRLEASDSNGNSIFDSREAGQGQLETAVKGGGSSGLVSIFLLMLAVIVKHKDAAWPSKISVFGRATLAIFFVNLAVFTAVAKADSHCGYEIEGTSAFNECWYLGAGIGVSHIDPEGESNGWRTSDDSDDGWEIILGYHLKEHWFGEFKYVDLGEAGLGNIDPVKTAAFPDASISYEVPSLMAGYLIRDSREPINAYVKAGIAVISNKARNDGGTVGFEEVTDAQFAFGLGLRWRSKDSAWFFNANFDSYDRDAWYGSISVNRFID